jgi:hypothetical protein
MQSIEYAQRALDKAVEDERERTVRAEKMLADFSEQAGRPYEHEAKLKDLLIRQAQLNALLDLDKGERQVAPEDGPEGSPDADGDAGGDDRAVDADTRAEIRSRGPWRNAPGQNKERNFDDARPAASARSPPSVPGTKF